jgi:nucleoside 2-deoxyribosyltransferase
MVITICGSLTFTDEIQGVADELEKLGHEVLLPNGVIHRRIFDKSFDSKKTKVATDAIRKHMGKVEQCDAVLVCNYTKNNIKNYIGANTFIEMAYAHYLNKPIFCLNELPDMPYIDDELVAFGAKVIDGDLGKISA